MSLNTPYAGIPITEVVPEAIAGMNEGLTKSSLLVSRRKIRFQPQTGTSVGSAGAGAGGNIIQFVLADSSSLLDVNSATISFNVKTSGTGNETLDDGVSWCRRLQISLNGNLVEDLDNCHRYTNMEIYGGADKAWYQSAGSYAGFWKFNPDLATAQEGAGVLTNPGYGDVSGVFLPACTRTTAAAGEDRIVPLSIMSGFFKTHQYVPLNLLGELVVSFTCANASEACWQATGATNADYSLSDIFMEVDVVQPHYMLQELMNKVANSEGENGIVIPYESPIVSAGQTLSSGSNLSVIISRATNNLRRILYAHQLTTGLSSANFPGVSTFGYNACTSWQVRIGSLYFPSQPATTAARMFGLLQSAYGEAVNDKPGLANRNIYEETTSLTGVATKVPGRNVYADMFIVGYNFDSYKNTSATQVLDADGVSVKMIECY